MAITSLLIRRTALFLLHVGLWDCVWRYLCFGWCWTQCGNNYQNIIHQWPYSPLLGPGFFFSFVIFFYKDGRTLWTSDQPVARPLPTHRTTQTQNKCTNRHPCLEWNQGDYYSFFFLFERGRCSVQIPLLISFLFLNEIFLIFPQSLANFKEVPLT
jgi:hypothetical protein